MAVRRKKSKISRTQAHILWGGVQNSAEILGQNIESAEVHYTKPEDGFRPNTGLNTKFRRKKKSAEVRYTICVLEFRRKTNLDQSAQWIPGHRVSIFRRKKNQQISCPILSRNGKKARRVCKDIFWNLRLQCKVLDPRPYLLAMGGTCDREELARITRGKSRGIGDEQYNHPLPWFGPMLFENSMEKGLI